MVAPPPDNLINPELTENGIKTMEKRFLVDECTRVKQTPKERFWELAQAVARADEKFDPKAKSNETAIAFYQEIATRRFIPASPTLVNGGRPLGQLSSCFVLPLEDTLKSIYGTLGEAAYVQRCGGGVGFDFSPLRPAGDYVHNAGNVAQGPVAALKTYNQALDPIRQGGRNQGAMGILRVDHPDILGFIDCKKQEGGVRNFNISVAITDGFMTAVRNDEKFPLVSPTTRRAVKQVRAREIWNRIVQNAWQNGEPGLIFIDTINRFNTLPGLGKITATNPCGEQPILPYESCNLAAVNLERMVRAGAIDWAQLKKTVQTLTHFMDNAIEINRLPLPQMKEILEANRKIGIGVMGFADMLLRLKIPYASEAAEKMAEEVMSFIWRTARETSARLAEKRGVFPNYEKSIYAQTGPRLRNAAITTIAPTGVTSIIGGTTPGIEPVFGFVTLRKAFYDVNHQGTETLKEVNPVLAEELKKRKLYSEELLEKVYQAGTLQKVPEIPADLKDYFQSMLDISPEWHIRIQAAFQKYVDSAVSKTINFPNSATTNEVERAYILAYELGCKGITVYRDGSRTHQNLVTGNGKDPVPVKAELATTLTPEALKVLEKRALRKNGEGQVTETPEGLWSRIASFVVRGEPDQSGESLKSIRNDFVDIQASLKFLCGGALIHAGQASRTMAKCFVLPIDDSIDSIFDMVRLNVQILRKGGGTGFNLSHIRSSKATVFATQEPAAGPVMFLKAINATMRTITGRGGRKMGAMAILNVNHPDIESFIACKDSSGEVENLNISVGITPGFMEAVEQDKQIDLVEPQTKQSIGQISARKLFDKIAEHAWRSGDPGVIFLENLNAGNTVPGLAALEATNPCGEQPLFPFESCNLGNVVLPRLMREREIDWPELERVVRLGVRFLDDVIDANEYPLQQIREQTLLTRKSGLGVMGFADVLIRMGIPYNSEAAVDLAETLMAFITRVARHESARLGKIRGSFPVFSKSVFVEKYDAMRNATVTTIAPTGSISIIANCTPGIEPLFAIAYRRENMMGGETQEAVHPEFLRIAKEKGFYSDELIKRIQKEGSLQKISGIPEEVKKIFVTAHDIDPDWHIRIQAAFQKYTDNAVSKTINLRESATVEDVKKSYQFAYRQKCKGVTIYRDHSKDEQAYSIGAKTEQKSEGAEKKEGLIFGPGGKIEPRKRPEMTQGTTESIQTGCGPLLVTINEDEAGICEVYVNVGKSGGCSASSAEALGRLISNAFRAGVDPEVVIDQLKGIRCPSPYIENGESVHSCADAIAKVLRNYLNRRESLDLKFVSAKASPLPLPSKPIVHAATDNVVGHNPVCPECGMTVEFSEGCLICRGCGYSKCG